MKLKRASTYLISLALVIALLPLSTHAQTPPEEPVADEGCTVAKQRITTHAVAAAAALADHSAKYTDMKNRIDTVVLSATEAKYIDIKKLTTTRDTVTASLGAYTAQAKVYATALETAQAAECGDDVDQFTDSLKLARTELATLRNQSLTVKTAVKQSAAPALRSYATWLKANTNTIQENV